MEFEKKNHKNDFGLLPREMQTDYNVYILSSAPVHNVQFMEFQFQGGSIGSIHHVTVVGFEPTTL